MKISGINNIKQIHLYTTTITYPRTVEIYKGHYPEKHILHNLKIKTDEFLKTNLDKNQTNVYGKKNNFLRFFIFATFFVQNIKKIAKNCAFWTKKVTKMKNNFPS